MNINTIQTTPAVAIANLARQIKSAGEVVFELQTGDPDFETPAAVSYAAKRAIDRGETHYSYSSGLPELRLAIAASLNLEFGQDFSLDNILVTHGAAQGIAATLSAILELGDEVIVLEPNWTTVDSLVTVNGGVVIKVKHMLSDDDLFVELNKVKSKKTKLICINSPNNPTGAVFSHNRIKALVDWAAESDIYVVSDEVYRNFTYDVNHASVLSLGSFYDRLIFVDSFSKKFAMTGWRVGFVVASQSTISNIAKASQVLITNVAPFVQYGALEAMSNQSVAKFADQMRDDFRDRRLKLLEVCKTLGLEVMPVEGAFYLFIKINQDDNKFSRALVDQRRVCVVPGSAFGNSGRKHIRVSFTSSLNAVEQGLYEIARFAKR